MINAIFGKIDEQLFKGKLDEVLIWANLEAKQLLLEQRLNSNERWAKLTKAINIRYPMLDHDGGVFLAATAMLVAKIGG